MECSARISTCEDGINTINKDFILSLNRYGSTLWLFKFSFLLANIFSYTITISRKHAMPENEYLAVNMLC